MKNEKHTSVVRLTSLALLAALIVVLQTVASGIKIGPVPISLTLVPIVVGAILFGPGAGAFLGGVFGVVCLIAGIAGTDQFTNLLWVANPFWLTVICVGKAVLCGWVAGLVYRALEKRQTLGCIAAAICAPIVNTGLFILGGLLLVNGTLSANLANFGAGGQTVVYFLIIGCAGLNFIAEFLVNLVVSPAINTIVHAVGNKLSK